MSAAAGGRQVVPLPSVQGRRKQVLRVFAFQAGIEDPHSDAASRLVVHGDAVAIELFSLVEEVALSATRGLVPEFNARRRHVSIGQRDALQLVILRAEFVAFLKIGWMLRIVTVSDKLVQSE